MTIDEAKAMVRMSLENNLSLRAEATEELVDMLGMLMVTITAEIMEMHREQDHNN